MRLISSMEKIEQAFHLIFDKFRKTARNNLFLVIHSLLLSENCQLSKIAVQMSKIRGTSFHANENKLDRFLNSDTFSVGDKAWRAHLKLVFQLLLERNFLSNCKYIPIVVDFTSHTDKFLILSAGIPFLGRAIPLYFSMRLYPKKKNQYDQVKMERAFLNKLHRLLPRKYKYLILADRGFGNSRFMKDCLNNRFDYLVRTRDSWGVEINGEKRKIKDLSKNIDYQEVSISNQETRLLSSYIGSSEGWNLFTSLKQESWNELINKYKSRFQIEKMFQDEKSSGFDIEQSKIEKYSKFNTLLYCVYMAQVITMFVGDWIDDNVDDIKKRYPIHISLISAYSR